MNTMAHHLKPRAHRGLLVRESQQRGFLLIEGLIAMLIFSLGVLGIIAMGTAAIAAQTDARFRVDAAALADEIANNIAIRAVRNPGTVTGPDLDLRDSLNNDFQHQPTGAATAAGCAFGGPQTTNPALLALLDQAVAGPRRLPDATRETQQIAINTGPAGFNQVSITICWQGPDDRAQRRHTLVTYIN
jgi:type IV pilus assembly protein PilV